MIMMMMMMMVMMMQILDSLNQLDPISFALSFHVVLHAALFFSLMASALHQQVRAPRGRGWRSKLQVPKKDHGEGARWLFKNGSPVWWFQIFMVFQPCLG